MFFETAACILCFVWKSEQSAWSISMTFQGSLKKEMTVITVDLFLVGDLIAWKSNLLFGVGNSKYLCI